LEEELVHDANVSSPVSWNARESDRKFWTGKRGLTIVQLVGIVLIFATLVGVFWSMIYWRLGASPAKGALPQRLIGNFGDWIVLGAIFVMLFLLLRWRVHRALVCSKQQLDNKK
jgi:hypothetical protein